MLHLLSINDYPSITNTISRRRRRRPDLLPTRRPLTLLLPRRTLLLTHPILTSSTQTHPLTCPLPILLLLILILLHHKQSQPIPLPQHHQIQLVRTAPLGILHRLSRRGIHIAPPALHCRDELGVPAVPLQRRGARVVLEAVGGEFVGLTAQGRRRASPRRGGRDWRVGRAA